MDKFYLIPITSRNVKIGDNSLFDMLKEKDAELYVREIERAKLTYESGEVSKKLVESGYMDNYKEYTRLLYKQKKVPEKLIVKKDEQGYSEYFTSTKLECDNETFFEAYSVPMKEIMRVVKNDSDYYNNVVRFIREKKVPKKSFFKRKFGVKHIK